MLNYNDRTCVIKITLSTSESVKGEHSVTLMKCGVFQKLNMDSNDNFS